MPAGHPARHPAGTRSGVAVYRLLAMVCLSTGTLGLLLPLLPTTPFLLLALWAASRGAPELAESLRNHPHHGPVLRAWERHRAIPVPARILATVMLSLSAGVLLASGIGPLLLGAILALFAVVCAWIWTRPVPKDVES